MEVILINKTDVRKYRQISKQVNDDGFNARARAVQDTELCDLLGDALFYAFMSFLGVGWIAYAGTVTRTSDTEITIEGADVSGWLNYSLKLNNDTYVIVVSANYDGTDTVLTVTGNNLTNTPNTTNYVPATITDLAFKTENAYTKLLNGTTYTLDSNTVLYQGIRPFLSWHWLSQYVTDGGMKQADMGNVGYMGETFSHAPSKQLQMAKDEYSQKVIVTRNQIVKYLDIENTSYPLWESRAKIENRMTFELNII